jgi:hypothetical protein
LSSGSTPKSTTSATTSTKTTSAQSSSSTSSTSNSPANIPSKSIQFTPTYPSGNINSSVGAGANIGGPTDLNSNYITPAPTASK